MEFPVPPCVDFPGLDCACATYQHATTMCKQYLQWGKCSYDAKCMFAHSEEERQRARGLFVPENGKSRLPIFNQVRSHVRQKIPLH